MNRTDIEWCDWSWNPITGCTRGCSYCYARRMAYRLRGRYGYPKDNPFAPTFHPDRITEPERVKKPANIFTVSMGDMFDPNVPELWILSIFETMKSCPQHQFQVLTKQVIEAHAVLSYLKVPKNLWLGISQDGYTTNLGEIEILATIEKPAIRFVSFEPLLNQVNPDLNGIDWVIIGARTGSKPFQPRIEWIRDIILEADNYDIPVFIKNNIKLCYENDRVQYFPKKTIQEKLT